MCELANWATRYGVLPEISPALTLGLSVLSMLPPLHSLWVKPTFAEFVRSVYMCGFGTFLFGWHVHEKAVMLITIPLCLIAVESPHRAKTLLSVSAAGCVSFDFASLSLL